MHHFTFTFKIRAACNNFVSIYNTIQYNTIQYNTIQYNTIQYNTIQCNTIRYDAIRYNTMQNNTIRNDTIWYDTIQNDIIQYILVMQCFRMGYRGICYASLVFSVYTRAFRRGIAWNMPLVTCIFFVYTRAFRRVCIRRKYKWQVACSTLSHGKALHNYFIPCLKI